MNATISEDAEVLGGGDGDAVLVERTELDGVTVERSFEQGHGCAVVLPPQKQLECVDLIRRKVRLKLKNPLFVNCDSAFNLFGDYRLLEDWKLLARQSKEEDVKAMEASPFQG